MLCHQRDSTASFHLHQSRINSTNSQAPMKNNKVHKSFVCHTVPSRLSRTNRSFPILAFIAIFAGCLLSGNVAHAAPVNLLKFPLTNAPGITVIPSDTSLGGGSANLSTYNGAGAATDFSGAVASVVKGAVAGGRAMCLTTGATGTATQSANGNTAANS